MPLTVRIPLHCMAYMQQVISNLTQATKINKQEGIKQ